MIARRKPSTSDAASSRPIAVRRRLDIDARPVVLRGKRFWHLKDPLSLRYWQFGEEELFLWQQLDGSVSLSAWQSRFRDRFAPQRIDLSQLQHFLGMLHREGLVYSDAPGQADTMLERRAKLERKQKFGAITNLLAIRFRGIDPESLLSRLYPVSRCLLHSIAILLSALFFVSALLLVLLRWPEFVARLPTSTAFLSVESLVWLAVALAFTKVLHELGHALTNRHFGGECHELGVLLLVFTPCLYCNVSDTWLVPEKWKRMAVSAAGMYVDLVLAAACTWLWWFSAPGLFHSLCFSVMVVGSAGTLLVNGNPLLRYDGYFILSDWLEIPNLKSEADDLLRRRTLDYVLGIRDASRDPSPLRRTGLLLYAIASNAYRLFVFVFVMWFIYQWFAMRNIEGVGLLLLAFVTACAVGPVVWQFGRDVGRPRRSSSRTLFWWGCRIAAVGVVVSVCFVPWPRRVTAPVAVRPHHAMAVYVSVPGILVDHIEPGTALKAGQPFARLENSEIDFQIVQLTSERDQLRKYCDLLRQQQVQDARAGVVNVRAQLPIAQQSLRDLEKQLQQREADRDQLSLTAPCDGILVAARSRPASLSNDQLKDWEGNPLASENIGCFLEAGVLVGYVVASREVEALVMLDQSVAGEIVVGQPTRIQIDELPATQLDGRVSAVSSTTAEDLPPELVAKGWFSVPERDGEKAPHGSYYQAKVLFEQPTIAPFGSSGRARITVAPRSLFDRARDSLLRTFRFSSH